MAETRFIFNTHVEYHFVKGAKNILTKYKRIEIIDKDRVWYKQI